MMSLGFASLPVMEDGFPSSSVLQEEVTAGGPIYYR